MTIVALTGCTTSNIEKSKELTKEQLREQEISKLESALLTNGYEKTENGFIKKIMDLYNDDGTVFNINHLYFDIKSLTYKEISSIDLLNIYVEKIYYGKINSSTGRTNFFKPKEKRSNPYDTIENAWEYQYDFNSGSGSCTSIIGGICNSQNELIEFKNQFLTFLSKNNINIELIK